MLSFRVINMRMDLVYTKLLEHYGYQGWWPLVSMKGKKGFDNLGSVRQGIITKKQSD